MAQTITSALAWWAGDRPDMPALSIHGRSITYREYHRWSEEIAASLAARGVGKGDRVAICGKNSLTQCALIMGIIRAGAIAVPVNFRYTIHEMRDIVGDTEPVMAIADEQEYARMRELDVPVERMSAFEGPSADSAPHVNVDPDPDAPIVIIATSGSTAKPKGVVYSHRTTTSYALEFAVEEASCLKGSRVVVAAPLCTSAGMVQLLQHCVLGCTIYFEPAFDAERYLEILEREKINGFAATPIFFERIAAAPGFEQADLSHLAFAVTGGSAVSPELQKAWLNKGVVLRQIYGQTEAGGNATIMPAEHAAAQPEKCGRGGLFTELATVDEDGRRCAPGEVGQILIRGPGCMVGYWNNPEATAETLRDGWLYTGDLGCLDEAGFLTFVDRIKDIIISGGLNISAAEVERVLQTYPGVEEAVILAARDDKFGETPLAVVHASAELDSADVVRHCNEHLADYKVPRYLVVEDEPLPRLATGKIAKPMLRQKYAAAPDALPRVR
ncbi:MAG: class I adenylate-forming enzyme family protein [Pseudomonadota bacterium]